MLLPGRLTYYESNDMRVHSGEFILERNSSLENLEDFSGPRRKLRNCFKVATKSDGHEIEMSAESEAEKQVNFVANLL